MYATAGSVHPMHMARKVPPQQPTYRRTHIRAWREHRDITLEALAEAVGAKIGGMTHASLSRIERGLQPYSQPILEAIAAILTNGDESALLNRDPKDPDDIWPIWNKAKASERRMIVDLAKTVIKQGS